MWQTRVRAALAGLAIVCGGAWAQAQCTTDAECKGGRQCQAGTCTGPVTPAAAAPAAVPATPGAPAEPAAPQAPAAPATAPATEPPLDPVPAAATTSLGTDEPAKRSRSTPMVVGGAVMVATGPLLLAVALLLSGDDDCEPVTPTSTIQSCSTKPSVYVLAAGGVLLIGAGIPLIVIGGEKVSATTARRAGVRPWLSPGLAGVKLQLEL